MHLTSDMQCVKYHHYEADLLRYLSLSFSRLQVGRVGKMVRLLCDLWGGQNYCQKESYTTSGEWGRRLHRRINKEG